METPRASERKVRYAVVGLGHIAQVAVLPAFAHARENSELTALVHDGIAATGATSWRDMGKVMGWLSPRTRGRADGKHVSELVVKALASADLAAHDSGTH